MGGDDAVRVMRPGVPGEDDAPEGEVSVDTTVGHTPATSEAPDSSQDDAGEKVSSVKTLDEVVQEVFDGKWGNGQEQRVRLTNAGYNHREVHEAVVARMNRGTRNAS